MAFQVDPVTGLQNSSLLQQSGPTDNELTSVDFMTLIITQMRNQNPLDPQSDSDWMAQMAQFEALNQMKTIARSIQVVQGLNELSSASSMIGREITGQQVNAIDLVRDMVSRELYGAPFLRVSSAQRIEVNRDDRVVEAAADVPNAGREVTGVVDRVLVGPDGIPLLWVNDKAIDLFTVAEIN
jgi:flagellar basal-body rod modification protein FlgD